MAISLVRWLLLAAVFSIGCDSLKNLFPSSEGEPDAGVTWPAADASVTGADAATASPGRDSAPAVSLPGVAPPSLAVEAPAIKSTAAALGAALVARDPDTAAAQFTPEVRARYRVMFATGPAAGLDRLAAALAQVEVTTVVAGSVSQSELRGEAVVSLDGRTFHAELVKRNGQWLVESL